MILLFIILGVLSVFVLSSVLTLCSYWKYYKQCYDKLPLQKFSRFNDVIWNQDNSVVWFSENNDFKIGGCGVYLHNIFYTYFDPYSLYWLIKYKKWFKENTKHLR